MTNAMNGSVTLNELPPGTRGDFIYRLADSEHLQQYNLGKIYCLQEDNREIRVVCVSQDIKQGGVGVYRYGFFEIDEGVAEVE